MESLANAALSNSLLATALAFLALAVSRLLKNKPAVAHILWLLVLVKLVTPPVFSVPVSWPKPHPIQDQLPLADPIPVVGADISALERQLSDLRSRQSSRTNSLPWPHILVSISFFGSILWLFRAAYRIRRFNQLLKAAELAPDYLQTNTLRLAKQLGMRRAPRVLVIDADVPPMVWCVGWNPRIFLPTALVAGVSARRLELIVTHELAHVKRRDYLIRWFELIVLAVYWWNPTTWLAVRRLRAVEEHCCDAMVVELNSADARPYVETLVQVVDILAGKRSVPSLASGIGFGPSLKRRCEMILINNASSHVGRLACLLILAIGITVLPLSVRAFAKEDSPADLEKRIARLEKLVENLRKALVNDASLDAEPSSKPRPSKMVHQDRPIPPSGLAKKTRKETLDALKQLSRQPSVTIETRIKQYELAFRLQATASALQKKALQLKAELRGVERKIKELQKSARDNNNLFLPLKRTTR